MKEGDCATNGVSRLAFNLVENGSNEIYDYPSVCAFIPTYASMWMTAN
jgi:hypothetical protein